jgi:alpha-D-xyloside xylohydrolase
MKWHDSGRKLTIGDTKGSYPGMLKNRTFKVVLQDGKQKIVHYNGKKVTVSF